MKILIDIGHPAHVHLFRNFARLMGEKGHPVLFTTRNKEFEIYLLKKYDSPFVLFGKHYKSSLGKLIGLIKFDLQMVFTGIKFKPDLFLSHGSIYAAHAAWFLRKPHIAMEDTGNMEQVRLYLPFTNVVLTSDSFHRELGKKQIRYAGYHELAYLHPKYFHAERADLKELKLENNEEYALLRFVSWKATHDKGQKGLNLEMKRKIIEKLQPKYRVFISSELPLPEEFKKYTLPASPEKIHSVLAFASLFITEGATMASECAMLGTPALYVNSIFAGTIKDQAKAVLLFNFKTGEGVLEKMDEFLTGNLNTAIFKKRKDVFLINKIDVTAFMVWFVENYPSSVDIMRNNPDFQYRFR
jgi:uncharacterized protein